MLLECETLARESDDDWSLAWVATLLGIDGVEAGDWPEAWLQLNQALESFNRLGSAHTFETLGQLGSVAAADGRYAEARDLIRQSIRGALDRGRNFTLPCLEAIEEAFESGRALAFDEAVELALGELAAG